MDNQTVTFFELDQPECSKDYGKTTTAGTCAAVLGTTGTHKCFNTKKTCQDPANYSPTVIKVHRFAVGQDGLLQYGTVLPFMEKTPDVAPGVINIGGMERSVSAFGQREVVTVRMQDGKHSDHRFDKYRLERYTGDAQAPTDSGTAQAGTVNSLTLRTGAPASLPDYAVLRLTAGAGSVQERNVSAYETRTNALTKSSAIEHANWTKQNGITITPNYGAAPDGSLKADRVQTDGISLARYFQTVTGFAGKTVVFALKMRSLTGVNQNVLIHLRETGFGTNYASADVVVTPVWQTFSVSAAIPGGSAGVMPLVYDSSSVRVWDFLACEHQFNEGTVPGPFVETDATAGSFQVATVSPRWRTNLLARSEEFDAWSKAPGVTVDVDAAVAPDGTMTADRINFSAAPNQYIYKEHSFISGLDYTASFYLRADTPVTVKILLATVPIFATVVEIEVNVTTAWQRFDVPVTPVHATNTTFRVHLRTNDSIARSCYAWGAQSEQVDEVGDYIKTEAAAITLPDATTDYEVREVYDPYERGTLWPRFLARNPFHGNYRCRIRRGVMGQPLEDMRTWEYVIDSISGPSEGKVTIKAKDLFSKVEARKAVFPFPSLGELNGALVGTPGTFNVLPAGIGNTAVSEGGYASITSTDEGWVAIGDEMIRVTRVGDTFTILERKAKGSVQEDHDDGDLVQLVGYLSGQVHDNIYSLLVNNAGVDPSDIPKAEWNAAVAASMPANVYTTWVPEPTPVDDLCGELMEQAGCTVWADTRSGRIEFAPLIPSAPVETIDDTDMVRGSLSLPKQSALRISRSLVYFNMRNYMEDVDDDKNFHARVISPDLSAEDITEYGAMSIRAVHSRWIPQGGGASAQQTAVRLLSLFRDPPREGSFKLHATRTEDMPLDLAVPFLLDSADVTDDTGVPEPLTMVPTKINYSEAQSTITAQQMRWAIDLGDPNVHEITFENDTLNVNLRTIHDSLFATPVSGITVKTYNNNGITIGSSSVAAPAFDTGLWPAGVALELYNFGRIQGRGGRGGNGGSDGTSNGADGEAGGTAILARYAISIDNEFGEIWGGGGGGGGGASVRTTTPNPNVSAGGGGGGSGAGYIASDAGVRGNEYGIGGYPNPASQNGAVGTSSAGGAGGGGGYNPNYCGHGDPRLGGNGGNGGLPGVAGNAGGAARLAGCSGDVATAPGTGGAAGKYIDGNAFVTWVNAGDVRGGIA